MECSHILSNATVNLTLKDLTATIKRGVECQVCNTKDSVWVCLTCGQLNCGRYVKAHALMHYEKAKTDKVHPVCMECNELSVFCYACDDFIVNDTNDTKLDRMRAVITKLQEQQKTADDRRHSTDLEVKMASDESGGGRRGKRRTMSSGSLPGGGEENQPIHKKVKVSGTEKSAEQKQRLKHLVGLRNLGNTCFMSAVLQSLGNIQEFCSVLKQLPSLEDQLKTPKNKNQRELRGSHGKNGISVSDGGPIMTEELRKVLVALNQGHNQENQKPLNRPSPASTSSRKVISPESLFHVIWKVVPRFRGYQQQDAHEFLRYMLDRLHTELLSLLPDGMSKDSEYFKQLRKQPMLTHLRGGPAGTGSANGGSAHSLVTQIFGGTLQSEVTCLVCQASSKKHDPFLDLSIDIPSAFLKGKAKQDKDVDKNCKLQDCLQKFVEVEELADSERFFCNNCKNKQRSTKKFWIRRLPNVLCLHLKRFRWSPYSRTKLDTHVEFPLSGMDMSPYLLSNLHETRCSNSGSSLYDLAAVIVHHGSGAGSGHYTAFVVKDNHWYHFNDSTVLATDQETVIKSKAYIMFYIQREFKAPKVSS